MTTNAIAERLVQRIELHPIQTVTLNSSEFLTDVKKESSVTIAGELRIPSGIEGRIPAVVLVHGAAGISMQMDPWAVGDKPYRDSSVHNRLLYRSGF